MIQLNRRPFLLLEMIIAMSLAVTVLSTLSFFYYQISMINIEMDHVQNENFQKRYVENRLSSIFPKTLKPNDASQDFHFFTSGDPGGLFMPGSPSLVFSYSNGVQLDKLMSYHVLGRIFLDPLGNLTLAKWPAKKRWPENGTPPITKEILLEGVEKLSFSFYAPPDKRKTKPDPKSHEIPPEIRDKFVEVWNKDYHELPAIIHMEVVRKNYKGNEETLAFTFPLPNTSIPITYND